MKAAVFEQPHRLSVVQKDLRTLHEGEALIRVQACGVCGTDVHIVEGTSRSAPPVILGHEYTGVVLDMVGESPTVSVGARVAVDPNISCGVCFFCRRGLIHLCSRLAALGVDLDGGMAEFSIVPISQLYPFPDSLTLEDAVFVEPVSCAVHGIDRAGMRLGDTVVIVGGGTIGLLMLQLARHAGAAHVVVVEPLETKRAVARTLGAEHVLDPSSTDIPAAVFDLTSVGADVVLECTGRTASAELALQLVRRGGTVEFFGVCPRRETFPIAPNDVYARELTVVGSYINPYTFTRAIELLASGVVRVDALTRTTFSLDHVCDALQAVREGAAIKTIISPQEG